jgi:hypothetical protein
MDAITFHRTLHTFNFQFNKYLVQLIISETFPVFDFHTMKTYGGVVEPHTVLISALGGGEWSDPFAQLSLPPWSKSKGSKQRATNCMWKTWSDISLVTSPEKHSVGDQWEV